MYPDPAGIPEELFVHYGPVCDLDHRVKFISETAGWLMKFDREDYFEHYIVPLIDKFYHDYPNATGAPAIFVDNCPSIRQLYCPPPPEEPANPDEPHPEVEWDAFSNDDEWFGAWQKVFRRIKSKYPNLRIYVNWGVANPDGGADKVLELVDHILFETWYGRFALRFYLAFAYRAQKLGKGVTFGSLCPKGPGDQPTLGDYNLPLEGEGDYDYKQAYFCIFLLTWGENTHWGGQWNPDPTPPSYNFYKIHDMDVLHRWFGVPAAGENGTDMWEMRPDLWTRNFVNAKVFLNLSATSTYTILLSEALDEGGQPETSIKLEPFQGRFVFRQPPQTSDWDYTRSWRQLPNFRRSDQSYPYSVSCDAIVSSLNLGIGATNENWISDSEDLTTWTRSASTVVSRPTDAVWHGIQMNEIGSMDEENDSYGPDIKQQIYFGSSLSGMHITIMFYAQQMDGKIQALTVGVSPLRGGLLQLNHTLRYGDYPQLVIVSSQLPHDADSNSCWVFIRPANEKTTGRFRVGAVRVLISSLPDNPDIGEYIRTTGGALRRGNGVGIGLPLSLVGLSGYLPISGRPQLPLHNGTQIVGLASGSGTRDDRLKLALGPNDMGYQYFDAFLGVPVWWSGTAWTRADGTPP